MNGEIPLRDGRIRSSCENTTLDDISTSSSISVSDLGSRNHADVFSDRVMDIRRS